MKRTELVRKIAKAAKEGGLDWDQVAAKGNHEKWRLGKTVQVAIPRHNEVNEITAQAILKSTEDELGKGWWK
jgi:predicted RNA binding protein YcfA (HicA-like mRNA interferase family)